LENLIGLNKFQQSGRTRIAQGFGLSDYRQRAIVGLFLADHYFETPPG
jgi:hypothetical protein